MAAALLRKKLLFQLHVLGIAVPAEEQGAIASPISKNLVKNRIFFGSDKEIFGKNQNFLGSDINGLGKITKFRLATSNYLGKPNFCSFEMNTKCRKSLRFKVKNFF